MVIQTRHTFGAFGAKSYTTPQRECSVGDYDGRPDGWQAWCDCMFGQDEVLRLKCRKRPCLNPLDGDPDCVFGVANPALAFAPWTEVGAGIRGIPKEEGGLLYLFGSSFAPPTPAELEPHTFFLISDRDPLRGAFLLANAGRVINSPEGRAFPWVGGDGGRIQLSLHYISLGEIMANIPIVGGVFTALNAAQMFLPAGPMAGMITTAARQYALAKDPSGELYVTTVHPVIKARGGDLFALLTGGVSAATGDIAGLATVIRTLCNRAGRMLPPDSRSQDVRIARALLFAAGKLAPKIAELMKDPQTTLQNDSLYADFGNAIAAVAKELKASLDSGVYAALLGTGDFFRYFSPSLAIAARSMLEGDPALLCCVENTAFDYLPYKVPGLGFKISTLIGIADDVAKSGQQSASQIQNLILNGENGKSGLQTIQQLFGAITVFAKELQKALEGFKPVAEFFSLAVERLLSQKAEFDNFINQTQQAAAAGTPPARAVLNAAAAQKLILGGGVRFRPPGTVPLTPGLLKPPTGGGVKPPVRTPTPAAGGGLAPVIAGAGAGFLVGGPVGALVGGGALVLLTKK